MFQSKIKYEKNIQKNIFKYIRNGSLIFDIGSNIGQYAVPFSELVGENGIVHGFEMDYKNYTFLEFYINYNRCKNLQCHNTGFCDADTMLNFFRDTQTGGRRGSYNKDYVGKDYEGYTNRVELRRFDTIVDHYGWLYFVKIDLEGFELEVIKGITKPYNDCIFLIEVRESTKDYIFNYFSRFDFKCICVDDENEVRIETTNNYGPFANLTFIHSDNAAIEIK